MSGSIEGGRRTRRRRYTGGTVAVFCLCIVLILSQLSLLAAAEHAKTGWSPPRKVRSLEFDSLPVVSSPTSLGDTGVLYGEEKRKVRTGPNPLHNK